ncbi:iron(III) transport system ATP-binding protein [Variovorax sp. TBS-050B]|uniref:ABC transporter ATP-binding protein n=1 Tax=Variovorax sp. TBS-050B TaxID=2940551 RepID=UPI00247401BC|nr:ABC transporter ATP-binding protein [Variovorax sp. TBS-050B]MDH6592979.1 iron(III) transport system ATP-binding protein [Variovorax sp. TBS-050B]
MGNGIEFRNVSKRYGTDRAAPPAVDGISFEVPEGTLTTILGPSGCGKTTTLRMIAGLESPSAGSILMGGRDVTTLGPAERNVSMMFQSYALFPHMNVIENVGYGLRMSGVRKDEAAARAREALRGVGLVGFDTRLPSELSGGQQQRVALARALVLEPAVLLFDEPLSNLDARLRREMREEIRTLQQRLKLTVAYVTHDQSEALAVSDQIIVMDHGTIAQRGTPEQLYARPGSEFVAGFMGEAMVFAARAEADGSVAVGPLRLRPRDPVAPGAVKVAVRPEAWRIGAAGAAEGLPATLRKAAYLGSFYEYGFDTALGSVFVVSTDLSRPLAAGAEATLSLAAHGVSVVPADA